MLIYHLWIWPLSYTCSVSKGLWWTCSPRYPAFVREIWHLSLMLASARGQIKAFVRRRYYTAPRDYEDAHAHIVNKRIVCDSTCQGGTGLPRNLRWAKSPIKKTPIATVQRTRSTLASHSAVPCGTHVKRMNANRAIQIVAQRTQVCED